MRNCPACRKEKVLSDFKTPTSYCCLVCDANRRERVKRYKSRNRQFVNQITSEWRKANPEKALAAVLDWQRRNPEKCKQYRKNAHARAMKNPSYRVAHITRARVNAVLKGESRDIGTDALMGGRLNYVRHIESLLPAKWDWTNFGKEWEIDHIKPLSKFDLTDKKQLREAFHFTNTQPLSVTENRKKGNKMEVALVP